MTDIINGPNDDASKYDFPPASEATKDSLSKTTATATAGVSLPNAPSVNNLERLMDDAADDDEEAKKIIVSEEAKIIVKESDDFFDDPKKPKESDDFFDPESSDSAAIACLMNDDEGNNVSLWAGNFSIYWLLGTLIGLWFIFIHTPQHITAKKVQDYSAVFWMHITLACFTYVACMWNVFHTPSHGPWYANVHILVGRTAVFTSLLGFCLGMVAAWWPGYRPGYKTPFGFAIGITSGGIAQIICTIVGFSAIKLHQWEKEKLVPDEKRKQIYLRIHIGTMLGLFFPSCGTPAVIRLFAMVGMKMQVGLPVGITIFAIMIPLTTRALDKKRWY